MKIDDAAARLEALGNPTRLRIYRTLVRAGEEGAEACLAGKTLHARHVFRRRAPTGELVVERLQRVRGGLAEHTETQNPDAHVFAARR